MKIEIFSGDINLEQTRRCRKDFITIRGIDNTKRGIKFCSGTLEKVIKVNKPLRIGYKSSKSKARKGFKIIVTGKAKLKGPVLLSANMRGGFNEIFLMLFKTYFQ